MVLCKCGCMQEVTIGNIFIWGHNKSFLGRKHTPDTLIKLSQKHMGLVSGNKGKKMSVKARQRLSQINTGENSPMWGKHHTEESKKKISKANKIACRGRKLTKEQIEKIVNSRRGYTHSEETRRKQSKSKIGDKNPSWNGGSSFYPYCPKFTKQLKEIIRERDNRTCQLCGVKENGKKLSVHHIHYDKPNCNPDLIALCISCHFIGIDPEL